MSDASAWSNPKRSPSSNPMQSFLHRLKVLEQLVQGLIIGAPLQSAAVSSGGLTVKDQGNLTVQDGGSVYVQDGGAVVIRDDSGGYVSLLRGRIFVNYRGDDIAGSISAGLATDGVSPAMWLIPPTSEPRGNQLESAIVVAGRGEGGYLGGVWISSLDQIQLDASGDLFIEAGAAMQIAASSGIVIDGGTGGSTVIRAGAGRQLQLDAGAELFLKANGTTTSAANTYISGSGSNVVLYQVSSSIRYKVDVEDHHTDQDALLSVVPKSWRDKAEAEADPDTTARYVGFIAEEMDELGLSEFVVYNPDGSPESVAYDRLTVGLLDVVKTQRQQIAWLAERVAQLSGETMPDFRPDPTPGVRATRPVPPSPIVEEEVP